MSTQLPTPPGAYTDFIARYPKLGEAWDAIHDAGSQGPLDERTQRLIKLAIAIGAMRQGAVHSSVRKARAMGIPLNERGQGAAPGKRGPPRLQRHHPLPQRHRPGYPPRGRGPRQPKPPPPAPAGGRPPPPTPGESPTRHPPTPSKK